MHNGVVHSYMLTAFRWHSQTKLELVASGGLGVLRIDAGTLTWQEEPGGKEPEFLDPEAARRLAEQLEP